MTPAGPPERLRLLWLTEHYPPSSGGMATSCDRIVRNLRRGGARVDVVHWSRRATAWRHEVNHGGSMRTCPLGTDAEHALARTWAELRVDPVAASATHVVAFGAHLPLLAAPVVAAGLGIPLITCLRGNDADTGVFSPRRRGALADAVRSSAHVCCVSRDKVALVESMWPGTAASWTPNGIEVDDWVQTAADRERGGLWRRTHVVAGRRVLAMFGHLKAKKGALLLVEALARLSESSRVHLLMVGELEDGVASAAGALLPEGSWTHEPFGDRYRLLDWLAACDAVAVPSFYDGLPNVVLEAAACAVPLVASIAGGMADLLEDGTHGWLFPPGDVAALASAVTDLARASDAEIARRGKAARALVDGGLDAVGEASRYLDVLVALG